MNSIDGFTLKKIYAINIIYISCLIFSTIAIFIAYINPSKGYELSIYESTPVITWILLILSIFGAISAIIYQLCLNQCNYYYYFSGIFILLLNRVFILSIPFIRGYYSWRGDNISHMGYIISIAKSGFFFPDDVYPIVHIFLSSICIITGLSLRLIANYSTALFSIFYFISIYLLARVTLSSKKAHILAISSTAVVFFSSNLNAYLFPNGWSIFYFPFAIFLYFKSLEKNKFSFTILFIIILFLYPFFHPLSCVFLIFSLMAIILANSINASLLDKIKNYTLIKSTKKFKLERSLFNDFNKCLKNSGNKFSIIQSSITQIYKYRSPLTSILIELIIFFSWILSFKAFYPDLKIFHNAILTGSTPDVIGSMQDSLNKINVTGMDFIELLMKMDGAKLIFLFLFYISLVILIKNKYELQKNQKLIALSMITLLSLFLYAAYLFRIIPGLEAIATARMITYIDIFTPISAGFVFSHLLNKKIKIKKVNIIPILCLLTIFVASMLSMSSVFDSPYVYQPTPSVTQMDIEGTEWFVNFHGQDILTTSIISPIYRFIDGIVGREEEYNIIGSPYLHINVPDHFNYTAYNKLGESYSDDRYMMITMLDTVLYQTVWSPVGRFNGSDFEQLLNDSSVEKLYSNGETVIFYIHTLKISS